MGRDLKDRFYDSRSLRVSWLVQEYLSGSSGSGPRLKPKYSLQVIQDIVWSLMSKTRIKSLFAKLLASVSIDLATSMHPIGWVHIKLLIRNTSVLIICHGDMCHRFMALLKTGSSYSK